MKFVILTIMTIGFAGLASADICNDLQIKLDACEGKKASLEIRISNYSTEFDALVAEGVEQDLDEQLALCQEDVKTAIAVRPGWRKAARRTGKIANAVRTHLQELRAPIKKRRLGYQCVMAQRANGVSATGPVVKYGDKNRDRVRSDAKEKAREALRAKHVNENIRHSHKAFRDKYTLSYCFEIFKPGAFSETFTWKKEYTETLESEDRNPHARDRHERRHRRRGENPRRRNG